MAVSVIYRTGTVNAWTITGTVNAWTIDRTLNTETTNPHAAISDRTYNTINAAMHGNMDGTMTETTNGLCTETWMVP